MVDDTLRSLFPRRVDFTFQINFGTIVIDNVLIFYSSCTGGLMVHCIIAMIKYFRFESFLIGCLFIWLIRSIEHITFNTANAKRHLLYNDSQSNYPLIQRCPLLLQV